MKGQGGFCLSEEKWEQARKRNFSKRRKTNLYGILIRNFDQKAVDETGARMEQEQVFKYC